MLAGYLAAGWSKTGKIGTYGGQQFPGVTRFMDGLYAGRPVLQRAEGHERRRSSAGTARCRSHQTGTFVGGGQHPGTTRPRASSSPQTFLDQGVDIVHPVAGATGNGTIKAMLAAGKWAIGVDTDQCDHPRPEYHAAPS